jgi:hypothetical protein
MRLACKQYLCSMRDNLQKEWKELETKLKEHFGNKPSVEVILFLIGLQETGFIEQKLSKEEKQDVMHVAVCTILSPSGYYAFEKKDEDGWTHFKALKPMPALSSEEQEDLLKEHILLYFRNQGFID